MERLKKLNFFIKFSLIFTLFSSKVYASQGYTFFSHISHKYSILEHILSFGFVAIILLVIGLFYRSKLSTISNILVPDEGTTFRNIIESYGEFIYGLCKSTLGEKDAKKYFTFISILFIFIFFNNFLGLIPGFSPATSNINSTLAIGLFVFIYYNYQGIKAQGIIGHIKHFMGPVWYLVFLIFPIEIISHLVRPLSLALRLRGNMMGDHLVLAIFSDFIPYFVPIIFMVLGLFVCFIQAFVFTLLTMVYISLATAHHDKEHT